VDFHDFTEDTIHWVTVGQQVLPFSDNESSVTCLPNREAMRYDFRRHTLTMIAIRIAKMTLNSAT